MLCILVTDYQNGRWIIYTERGVEKMLRVVEVATQKQIQSKIGLDFNDAIAYSEKKIKN